MKLSCGRPFKAHVYTYIYIYYGTQLHEQWSKFLVRSLAPFNKDPTSPLNIASHILGASCDLVASYNWADNPTYVWPVGGTTSRVICPVIHSY